jgi:hypothetical protein
MRAGRPLHVEGTLTRTALRNLRELSEGWHDWRRDQLARIEVSAASVVEDRVEAAAPSVLMAWSRDIRSSFAVAGGERALSASRLRVEGALHVTGVGEPLAAPIADSSGALDRIGVRLHRVDTNAHEANFIDPTIGRWPIVAAALHFVGSGRYGVACNARPTPIRTQLVRPRPRPTLGDFYSGGRLTLREVGGTEPLNHMAAYLNNHPRLVECLAVCSAPSANGNPCRRCQACRLAHAAFVGANLVPPPGLGRGILGFARLRDAEGYCETELLWENWQGTARFRRLLGATIAAAKLSRAFAAERAARKARLGTGPVWPR